MATDAQRAWNGSHRTWRTPGFQQPKLTTGQRAEISRRLADGETPQALALEYGVTARHIRALR